MTRSDTGIGSSLTEQARRDDSGEAAKQMKDQLLAGRDRVAASWRDADGELAREAYEAGIRLISVLKGLKRGEDDVSEHQ